MTWTSSSPRGLLFPRSASFWSAATGRFMLPRTLFGDERELALIPTDVSAGNLWILIPLWVAVGPATVRAIGGESR